MVPFCPGCKLKVGRGNERHEENRFSSRPSITLTLVGRSVLRPTFLANIRWDTLAECYASTVDRFFTWEKKYPLSDISAVKE